MATLTAQHIAPTSLSLERSASLADRRSGGDVPEPSPITVDGKTYYLFYGDLHRHTDLSLCRVPIDGTIDDAYRYAIDVAQLDFLGITDHSRDIAQGDPLSQLWWRSRKEVYRHQLVAGKDMAFVPFYAYERSHGNTADHNVISLRGDMLRPHTYPVPVFWKELDVDTMTIPHQPIRRDTWAYQNDELRPLVEIYQGCRDTSIEQDVHEGLARGYHLGFIASSDHMSTRSSYACVWAEQPTRVAIFRAPQARRTFAATDKIWLAVLADDQWMGEIYQADHAPRLTLCARGTARFAALTWSSTARYARRTRRTAWRLTLTRHLNLPDSTMFISIYNNATTIKHGRHPFGSILMNNLRATPVDTGSVLPMYLGLCLVLMTAEVIAEEFVPSRLKPVGRDRFVATPSDGVRVNSLSFYVHQEGNCAEELS